MSRSRGAGDAPRRPSDARRALAVAREIGYRSGEVLALVALSWAASYAGDHDDAVRLARQAAQITAGIPGSLARVCSFVLTGVLVDAGDLAAAEGVGAAALARARDAGDLWNQADLLPRMADLDLRAGRLQDAAAHLREGLQLAVRTGSREDLLYGLYLCGTLCAATGRPAEALTVWAAYDALAGGLRHVALAGRAGFAIRPGCARPGRRSNPSRRGRPRSAALPWAGPPRPSMR